MGNIFETYTKEQIEDKISLIIKMIGKAYTDIEILSKLDFEDKEELLSLARARIKADKDLGKYIGDIDYFNLDDLRFATPQAVADYRAKRLKCSHIADLCSGVGIQSGSFCKTCKKVLSVEIDKRKSDYAKANFLLEKNIDFLNRDVLDAEVIEKINVFGPEIIFCDPERLESEKERNVSSIKPDLRKIIPIYSKITKNICVEVPPQIELDKLQELKEFGDFEAEYISMNNKLNRLDIYFGELKKAEVSVVDVNTGARLEKQKYADAEYSINPKNYIYEASTAILKAGLECEFASALDASIIKDKENEKKLLLTSEEIKEKAVDIIRAFSKTYSVVGVAKDPIDAIDFLKKKFFGSVVLKYSIDPKDYWKERKRYENQLRGNKEAVIYLINSKLVICEEIE